jgi:hypothetical protein
MVFSVRNFYVFDGNSWDLKVLVMKDLNILGRFLGLFK